MKYGAENGGQTLAGGSGTAGGANKAKFSLSGESFCGTIRAKPDRLGWTAGAGAHPPPEESVKSRSPDPPVEEEAHRSWAEFCPCFEQTSADLLLFSSRHAAAHRRTRRGC